MTRSEALAERQATSQLPFTHFITDSHAQSSLTTVLNFLVFLTTPIKEAVEEERVAHFGVLKQASA